MKVALFAPELTPEAGGIWQFYQWAVRHLGQENSLLLFAPAELLHECMMFVSESESIHKISSEYFRSSLEQTIAYRILLEHARSGFDGKKKPGYWQLSRLIQHLFYKGSIIDNTACKILQKEKVQVVHVPVQHIQMRRAVKRFPHILNPHDFQHEYFPEFFAKDVIEYRRTVWYEDQRRATALVVHSQQTHSDAVRFLNIPEDRIFYAPYGPLNTFPEPDEETLYRTSGQFKLPKRFVLYPARTWPHKNHIALVKAVHILKKRGIRINVVFTYVDQQHGNFVRKRVTDYGLDDQVIMLGRVSPVQMGVLYRLSTMVVVPSLFEQNSGPVLEAIHFGKAVAASNIDEIVKSLDGAGMIFDPCSVDEIAKVIDLLWSSSDTLEKIETGICKRRSRMSWVPFREIYKQAYAYAVQQGC